MAATYSDILQELDAQDNLRVLRDAVPDGRHITYGGKRYLNFSSNDYLGIASRGDLQRRFLETLDTDRYLMGNPSSRLMTGNSEDYPRLESALSKLYGGRGCLVFGSGYLANSAVLPSLTFPGDVILADRLVHASIIDGLRLSGCTWERFRHNDTEHLATLVRKHRARGCGRIWVATESVFSMDGDHAPIRELVELKDRYDLNLYLDEAHAFGVYGASGEGLAGECGLSGRFDVIVATLGKAAASEGAFVVCDEEAMREVLINRARTVIFSTALPPVSLMWSEFVVSKLASMTSQREHLRRLERSFDSVSGIGVASQIIPVMAYGNKEAAVLADRLRTEGYWVTPIRYPTVPRGQARVRLSLTAAMQAGEIEKLAKLCASTL